MSPTATEQTTPSPALLDLLIREHRLRRTPRLERLWSYYRNDLRFDVGQSSRSHRMAQERGLPARLTSTEPGVAPREVVIENDIAWRIHAMVDFMFGQPVALQSCAPDAQRARLIERFLQRFFQHAGGVSFFQDLALLGSVYGYADVLLRVDLGAGSALMSGPPRGAPAEVDPSVAESRADEAARLMRLEVIDAPRAVPVLDPTDYRRLEGFVLNYELPLNEVARDSLLDRVRQRVRSGSANRRARLECTELWTREQYTLRRGGDRKLVEQQVNPLGRVPVVHIQNLPQPFFFEGLSEVEPLIPLQDELNTRLSDRANRVTFQSFKMYLGKGIEKFTERSVGPGQMWSTDNPDATIQEFGGDASSPSEDAHIDQIREAMDKASTVPPIAAGLIQGRLGNLTSESALRIVLMGLLAKTQRKRVTYGAGIERMCELVLHAADALGVLPNHPDERRVRLDWPSPLPEQEQSRLEQAKLKLDLGVPRKQVLTELGYSECADDPA